MRSSLYKVRSITNKIFVVYWDEIKQLEMSSTAISKRLISREEYHMIGETGMLKPDERLELINGEIYTMCPIGSKHAGVVDQLTEILVPALVKQAIVRIQNPVRINQWNEPEPDISILNRRKGRYLNEHPSPADILAVIEVSDTTYEFDKNVKLPMYAGCGIPVYWIVNLDKNNIEVYSNPRRDQYDVRTLYHPGDKIPLLREKFDVSEILVLSS